MEAAAEKTGQTRASPRGPRYIGAVFFASGAAALVFELAWLRLFVNVFGHTTYSTSAVLAAFMGGLALGGWIFGRRAERSADPWRLYGVLELGAAPSSTPRRSRSGC